VLCEDELDTFIKVAKHNDNKIGRYTLCYYYQNLKYISPKNNTRIIDTLLCDNGFDMMSLLFCILNSGYIFTELIESVKKHYLDNECFIPTECKDGVLPDRLYSYIISARYHKYLEVEDF
jgi:hypothetical protein